MAPELLNKMHSCIVKQLAKKATKTCAVLLLLLLDHLVPGVLCRRGVGDGEILAWIA